MPVRHPDIAIEEVWIPLPDGNRLAADLYLPGDHREREGLPVLLEYLPYRKDEHRRSRYPIFSYFVKRGYIVARVDIRGTGRSEGQLIHYEYTDQEQEDALVVIDWLAKQSFSNGSIGMFGISWGGFNAIQIAARKPPALKAILAMMATDDLYEDDVHFMDGMMHVDAYEIGQDLANVIPPAPDYTIDEAYFNNRFDTEPWLLTYKRQQRDGPFWDRASLNHHYAALTIPIFMISGWYDGYRDSTPRILQSISAPKKAIVGPWNHTFPHHAEPPPAIEWRAEAVRWFDYWLKGQDNGILDEPELAVFIRDGHGPDLPDTIRGVWRWLDSWPSAQVAIEPFFLQPDARLETAANKAAKVSLDYKAASGIEAGGSVMWWGDWCPDQKNTDTHSLVFESAPLAADLIILGFPQLHLSASVSARQAHFLARLSDVSPDSSVTLITGAGLNGAHRYSSSDPAPLQPDKEYELDIEMHFTSWTFRRGHRIRLSVSNGQWPMIWPNPSALSMTLTLGGPQASVLELPVFHAQTDPRVPQFETPVADPALPGYETTESGTLSGFAEVAETKYNPQTGVTCVIAANGDRIIYPWATWISREKIVHEVNDRSPAQAAVNSEYSIEIRGAMQPLKWTGLLYFSSDSLNFYYQYTRQLMQAEKLIREKSWRDTIPRDFQ